MFTIRLEKSVVGLILLILLGFTWGTGYSIARFAMTNGIPPFAYSFWQAAGPALLLSLFARPHLAKKLPRPGAIRFYLISSMTGIVIPNTIMYFAASHVPAGILAMVVNIVPIFVYPLALVMKLENFNWLRLTSIALAFSGLLFILLPKSSLPSNDIMPWILLTLITPLSFAFCSINIACFRPQGLSSLTLASGMLLFATFILAPIMVLTKSFYLFQLPLTLPDCVILLEVLLSSLGYILYFQIIKLAGPVYYSLVDAIVVLTSLFWSYLLFNEHLNEWTSIALCLIITALLLVTHEQRKRVFIKASIG